MAFATFASFTAIGAATAPSACVLAAEPSLPGAPVVPVLPASGTGVERWRVNADSLRRHTHGQDAAGANRGNAGDGPERSVPALRPGDGVRQRQGRRGGAAALPRIGRGGADVCAGI